MPFILFSGWLLAGIEANPGDITLVRQAAILIGLGFSFLLAVFPFYSWIPLLKEESSPYKVGFILWMFPTVTLFFGLGFLDHYSWLRDAAALKSVLTTIGILMVVSGGLLAAFQEHLGRIMGYAVIMQTGFSILTLSLGGALGLNVFYMLLVPRTLSLVVWALALDILKENSPTLNLSDVKGLGRTWPFATSGLVLANLTVAGISPPSGHFRRAGLHFSVDCHLGGNWQPRFILQRFPSDFYFSYCSRRSSLGISGNKCTAHSSCDWLPVFALAGIISTVGVTIMDETPDRFYSLGAVVQFHIHL
jgi:hypothetical protein